MSHEEEPFSWVTVQTKEEAKQFYESILPKIRQVAKECGYAIGVHGSLMRDLDLIATPWVSVFVDKEVLVRSIHRAACGIESTSYSWEKKPGDRVAASFPICFPEWNEPNGGHIDLSIVGLGLARSEEAGKALREALIKADKLYASDSERTKVIRDALAADLEREQEK